MWCAKLILIYYLGTVYCRPQDQQSTNKKDVDSNFSVEIERQLIKKVIPTDTEQEVDLNIDPIPSRKIDASTKEILDKIAEVNKNQGLVQKKSKPNYFHFPFSYSRSQESGEKSSNFKFSSGPFTNAVFAYLESGQESRVNNNYNNKNNMPSYSRSNLNSANYADNYIMSMTDPNAEIKPEDHIPGQYIKRKITHYQSFLVPNPYMFNPYDLSPSNIPISSKESTGTPAVVYPTYPRSYFPNKPYRFPSQQQTYSMYPIQTLSALEGVLGSEENNIQTSLEKKKTNQNYQSANYFPANYHDFPVGHHQNFPYLNQNSMYSNVFSQNNPEKQTENLNMQKVRANDLLQRNKARQNWNWPGAGFFPIYVRDPFLQMYYAITNMIEYGPNSGNDGPCKLTPRPQGSRIKINSKTSLHSNDRAQQAELQNYETDIIKVFDIKDRNLTNNLQYLDVEDIDIGGEDLIKLTIHLPKESFPGSRELKDDIKSENIRTDKFNHLRNDSALFQLSSGKLDFLTDSLTTKPSLVNQQLTTIKDQTLQVEEIEDEALESEKADDINISNQGTKKVFSRENTGSGIFIHKLKVRQGGVAIAGPGGIATAGSGGTAIVGPNGVAYTHPNGLAIAGSGTKVVAVDPDIDLNEVIKDSVINGTRHIPNTRVGKIVAVGPVVYYNRG